tara:strand:- start:1923 stop:2573 length:651 start_codon:yes stop_codon:yes gene_type:complete
MFLRVPTCLVLSFFFLALSGITDIAESQKTKKQARIEGFRSAKFGTKEKNVLKAIAKDFKISKSNVKRKVNPLEKTTTLEIQVPKLFAIGGPAKIFYTMGYKSQKLMTVNIVWGQSIDKKVDPQTVIDAANFLRNHFVKKEYKKEGFLANSRLDDATTIVFRGKDKKNRMALLVLSFSKKEKNEDAQNATKNISLRLSYMVDPKNPDIYTIKENDF